MNLSFCMDLLVYVLCLSWWVLGLIACLDIANCRGLVHTEQIGLPMRRGLVCYDSL